MLEDLNSGVSRMELHNELEKDKKTLFSRVESVKDHVSDEAFSLLHEAIQDKIRERNYHGKTLYTESDDAGAIFIKKAINLCLKYKDIKEIQRISKKITLFIE